VRRFPEQVAGLTARHARRSIGLRATLEAIGLALAARAAARLASTAPELCGRVSPLRTAAWSRLSPAVRSATRVGRRRRRRPRRPGRDRGAGEPRSGVCRLQDLIGPAQLGVLRPQPLQLITVHSGQSIVTVRCGRPRPGAPSCATPLDAHPDPARHEPADGQTPAPTAWPNHRVPAGTSSGMPSEGFPSTRKIILTSGPPPLPRWLTPWSRNPVLAQTVPNRCGTQRKQTE
jgi:hypothetical protein